VVVGVDVAALERDSRAERDRARDVRVGGLARELHLVTDRVRAVAFFDEQDDAGGVGEVAAEARGVEPGGDVGGQELGRGLRRAGQREGERGEPGQGVAVGLDGSADGHSHARTLLSSTREHP
jgi:hypothetical protein